MLTYTPESFTLLSKGGILLSLTNKLNALLALSGKTKSDAAEYFGIKRQSVSNKFQRETFSIEDIIGFCDLTGSVLMIQHPSGQTITLDKSDLVKTKEKEGET